MTSEVHAQIAEAIAQDAAAAMPETRHDLRNEIASVLGELMRIPANAAIFAHAIARASIEALSGQHEQTSRQAMVPILVKAEYPGCARTTVTAPTVEGELLGVTVERRNAAGEWSTEGLDAPLVEALTKMTLSQTAVIGDVFYVTTSAEVNAHMEAATDAYHAQATQSQEAANTAASTAVAESAAEAL